MAFDTYGIPEEDYLNIFENKAAFAMKALLLLSNTAFKYNIKLIDLGEKFTWSLFSELAYETDEEARLIQKEKNPEEVKRRMYDTIVVSRDEMMEEIKSVNAKTEALTDYIAELSKKFVEQNKDGFLGEDRDSNSPNKNTVNNMWGL